MLSLCKKEIQLQNLLKKIVKINSEDKIYLLIQIVKFSNSDSNSAQAVTAASNV